ncbi:MAG TPA: hypothetical protein VM165_17090 [Planctomycetaceae bacterium]|nr:hypothetical protein [Planctomycetaceae bacterium]
MADNPAIEFDEWIESTSHPTASPKQTITVLATLPYAGDPVPRAATRRRARALLLIAVPMVLGAMVLSYAYREQLAAAGVLPRAVERLLGVQVPNRPPRDMGEVVEQIAVEVQKNANEFVRKQEQQLANNTLMVGDRRRVDQLGIEFQRVSQGFHVPGCDWSDPKPVVVTIIVTNSSQGQVFAPTMLATSFADEFGNEADEQPIGHQLAFDPNVGMVRPRDRILYYSDSPCGESEMPELSPGKAIRVRLLGIPKNERADQFVWEFAIRVNNSKAHGLLSVDGMEMQTVRLTFSRADMQQWIAPQEIGGAPARQPVANDAFNAFIDGEVPKSAKKKPAAR